jgi:hypothetical protein
MEVTIMATAISGVGSVKPPQDVVPAKPKVKEAAPKPKGDVVTISAKGKQAVQLRTAGSTSAEEAKEPPIAKAVEAQAGKK